MERLVIGCLALGALVSIGAAQSPSAQTSREPDPLTTLIEAERAFAARARVVGWKQAFLEYFADDAIGFDGARAGSAKAQIRAQPDPPKDLQLLWEPRSGDIAASGELGYLTGPSTSINPERNNGMPRHSNYASVWKRQSDGAFKVVIDVGIPTPGPVPFPAGFTRARAQADHIVENDALRASTSLRDADGELTRASASGQAAAYGSRLAPGARLHRAGHMPIVGEAAILPWLRSQPAYTAGASRYAEAARSGDLGYTWGTYALPTEQGFYVRVWLRGRNQPWKVVLDVLQPQ